MPELRCPITFLPPVLLSKLDKFVLSWLVGKEKLLLQTEKDIRLPFLIWFGGIKFKAARCCALEVSYERSCNCDALKLTFDTMESNTSIKILLTDAADSSSIQTVHQDSLSTVLNFLFFLACDRVFENEL